MILKNDRGFIVISKIGSVIEADRYQGQERVLVKIDGENVALFAPSKEAMNRRVDALMKIMVGAINKGNGIYVWEEL